jgi:hypothetical protein
MGELLFAGLILTFWGLLGWRVTRKMPRTHIVLGLLAWAVLVTLGVIAWRLVH